MKRFLIAGIIIFSCNSKSTKIDNDHIKTLAKDFMKNTVIPKMKDPKPYEITDAKVVVKTAADRINDYRFVYEHFSFNEYDSAENKRHLDSIINISKQPDAVISITVNVAYKTKYKFGDIVTDSIKLGYNPGKDQVTYWPF